MTIKTEITELITCLRDERNLSDEDLEILIDCDEATEFLGVEADKIRRKIYGDAVYLRGLIEMTNYCKNKIGRAHV